MDKRRSEINTKYCLKKKVKNALKAGDIRSIDPRTIKHLFMRRSSDFSINNGASQELAGCSTSLSATAGENFTLLELTTTSEIAPAFYGRPMSIHDTEDVSDEEQFGNNLTEEEEEIVSIEEDSHSEGICDIENRDDELGDGENIVREDDHRLRCSEMDSSHTDSESNSIDDGHEEGIRDIEMDSSHTDSESNSIDDGHEEGIRDIEMDSSHTDSESTSIDDGHEEGIRDIEIDSSDEEIPGDERVGLLNNSTPLYTGAGLSVAEHILSTLLFCVTYNISGEAISSLLVLLSLHCMQPNLCKTSRYLFDKIISAGNAQLTFHYFCSNCFQLLPNKTDACSKCLSKDISYFLEIPLLYQIQSLFNRKGFFSDLQHRFNRKKIFQNNIEDIYDGDIYKRFSNGFLNNPNNISLMWYTDGVSIFKSSHFSIWPIYFSINELPVKKRILKQNILMAGLWFGSQKPLPHLFMRCIYDSIHIFQNQGFIIKIEPNNETINVKGMVLCGTCDLPAKSLFCNSTQYNGHYGCFRCKERGEAYKLGPRSSVHVYPYHENVILRTHEETLMFAEQARVSKVPLFGIKGPSIISSIVCDIIKSTAIDVMHGVYLGVVRRLCHLWFDPEYSSHAFSLSKMVNVVDKRLLAIKPPSFIQRVPRSIKHHLKYWKAHEFKAWFYYYSVPVLSGIMDDCHMEHFMLFVSCIYLLNKCSISQVELSRCTRNIKHFVKQFQQLYGKQFMSINVHQLLHLTEVVRDLGPLWVTSCFQFEDKNGQLSKLVHGTQYVQLQICKAITTYMKIPAMCDKLPPNSSIKTICKHMNFKGKVRKIAEIIDYDLQAVGTYSLCQNLSPLVQEALRMVGVTREMYSYQTFKRLKKSGVEISCSNYSRVRRKMSHCVSFKQEENLAIGLVQQFLRLSQCLCSKCCLCQPAKYYAIVKIVIQKGAPISPFLYNVEVTETTIAINVYDIRELIFWIDIAEDLYVAHPVNMLEYE